MLARSRNGEGTLKLSVDDHGLRFEAEIPDTQLGHDIYEHIRLGNLDECSFCFSLPDNEVGERWYYNDSKDLCREISLIEGLYDCAICPHGAYSDTEVSARNYAKDKAEQLKVSEKQEVMDKLNKYTEDLQNLSNKI